MRPGSHVPDSGDELRGQQSSHREVSSVPNRTSLWNAGHLAQGARGSSRPDPAWAPSAPGFRRHLQANARKGASGQGRRRRGGGEGEWQVAPRVLSAAGKDPARPGSEGRLTCQVPRPRGGIRSMLPEAPRPQHCYRDAPLCPRL